MLNLPTIKATLKGTKLEVKILADGDLFPTRSEWLQLSASKYFTKHPDLTRADIFQYLLWLMRDKDHICFTFGDNQWHYVQFMKEGENLILDFPYNNRFGNRRLQVDRVEQVLKHYGFTRFIIPSFRDTLHYDDYSFPPIVTLEASFGSKRNDLAIEVMLAIVSEVFHLALDCSWSYVLGSQRD